MSKRKHLAFFIIGLLNAQSGLADNTPPLAYVNIAKSEGIPPRLLYAVALQESRLNLGNNTVKPWPWTLNVKGKGYRFNSDKETIKAINEWLGNGVTSIDIGLMQVNWYFHGDKFDSVEDAVHPYKNIKVGAQIIKHEHSNCDGDWFCAVGRYHSYRVERSKRYSEMVKELWSQNID